MTTFNVQKGKWRFTCEVQEDTLSAEAKAKIETIYDLLSQEVVVTKRVSLPELRHIIDSSCSKIPEFYVSFANTGSFDHFNQFLTYLASRDRAGVATLSPDYWFILIPEGHLLKCMIVQRITSPPTPEAKAPPPVIEPIVPMSQLGLPEAEPLPVVETTPEIATPTPAPKQTPAPKPTPKPMPIQDLTPNVLDAMLGLQQLHALSMQAPDEPARKCTSAEEETKSHSPPQTPVHPEPLPCHPEPLPTALAKATSDAIMPEHNVQPTPCVPSLEPAPQIPTPTLLVQSAPASSCDGPDTELATPQRNVDKPAAANDNRPTDPRQNKRRRLSTDTLPPSIAADALPLDESLPAKPTTHAVDYTDLLRVHKCFHAMQYLVHGHRIETTKPRRSRHDRD